MVDGNVVYETIKSYSTEVELSAGDAAAFDNLVATEAAKAVAGVEKFYYGGEVVVVGNKLTAGVKPTPAEYTVTWSDEGHGTTSATVGSEAFVSGTTVKYDTTVTLTFAPEQGCYVSTVKVNGVEQPVEGNTLEVVVTANTTIEVEYAELLPVELTWNTVTKADITVETAEGELNVYRRKKSFIESYRVG
jgi:hypothetical protein